VNHETPLILEEEPIIPFVPCPPFPVVMWVPPCCDCKVGKSKNQISNSYSHSFSTFHDSDSMEEILDWLRKPTVKTNSSVLKDDVTVHNFSLESDFNFCYFL